MHLKRTTSSTGPSGASVIDRESDGCLESEFKCHSTSRCISASLVCDGVDNCADSSDESTQFEVCGKRLRTSNPFIGTTVGVAVCLLIVAFLMAAATGKAKRQRRSRRANTTSSECHRHHSPSTATGLPGPQVSDLSTIHSLSTEQLSSGPLRHQAPAANHVTVATVTHDVIRATPPPAYESLFPTDE